MKLEPNSRLSWDISGVSQRADASFFRGKATRFWPIDKSLDELNFINSFIANGPKKPFIDSKTRIVAFGSCFAQHISFYLEALGYNVSTKRNTTAYFARMGDGIVNTYALLQQFKWAWLEYRPSVPLWHDYDNNELGYGESERLITKKLLDDADVFILTLGLSEVWYDEPTGEVFWRAVPIEKFDESRHKFRKVTQRENLDNLKQIYDLIRHFNPSASIIFSLSPIPLTATFRPMPCMLANTVSKASLSSALDEMLESVRDDAKIFYFPSYEIVLNCFNHQFMEDRRHIHHHILNFAMKVFERYFCCSGLDDNDIKTSFDFARGKDRKVGSKGHWSVKRKGLRWSKQP